MLKWPKIIDKNLSIKLSIIASSEIALLLCVSLLILFHFSRQALKEEVISNAVQTLESTTRHIDNILLTVEQSTRHIYPEVATHLDQPERMQDYCRQITESNHYIEGCAIAFKPGYYQEQKLFMTYLYRKGKSIAKDTLSELMQQETFTNRPYTEQVWYTKPVQTGRACWVGPLKNNNTEEEALITFCLPLFDQDKNCIGVVATDVSISLLSQIILSVKPSQNGYCTLLAEDGSYIIHPDTVKLYQHSVFTQSKSVLNQSIKDAAQSMIKGESGYKTFRMNTHSGDSLTGRQTTQSWHVFFKPFHNLEVPDRTINELKWSVGVVFPDNDIFLEYNQLLYYIIGIAIIGILILFLLFRVITSQLLKPLHMLTHTAQQIAKGAFDETIPATQRDDEIGQLQEHFKNMQEALIRHISEQQRLTEMLDEQGKMLRKSYSRAKEADRMKTAFLHYMTNQMVGPADAINACSHTLCDNYCAISREEAENNYNTIQQQGDVIIDVLDQMIHTAENELEKEDAHE